MNRRRLTFVLSLIMGCILLIEAGCSTYVYEEERPNTKEEQKSNGESTEGNNNLISSDTIYTEGILPESESILGNKFLVWNVTPVKPSEVLATLITLDEFYDTAADAITTMESLSIDGLYDWHFFTQEEAKAFRNQYSGSNIYGLNAWLLENGFSPFKHDSDQRYLCAEGTKTFAFYSQTISKAGQKKKYYYRGVKTVVVKAASQR